MFQNHFQDFLQKPKMNDDSNCDKIKTDKVIFAGGVKVNDFKAGILKQGELLSVNSKASINNHTLNYSREKSEEVDINLISSSDITHFVHT